MATTCQNPKTTHCDTQQTHWTEPATKGARKAIHFNGPHPPQNPTWNQMHAPAKNTQQHSVPEVFGRKRPYSRGAGGHRPTTGIYSPADPPSSSTTKHNNFSQWPTHQLQKGGITQQDILPRKVRCQPPNTNYARQSKYPSTLPIATTRTDRNTIPTTPNSLHITGGTHRANEWLIYP